MSIPTRKPKAESPALIKPNASCIVFDIETIPQATERLLAIAPEFKPDSRLKDAEKIKASIAEKKQSYLDDAALHWTTAHIPLICIGGGGDIMAFADEEAVNIRNFFQIASGVILEGGTVCGHNILGFDLPMLVNRARALKLEVPAIIGSMSNGRWYWNENIIDTLQVLTFGKREDMAGNSVEQIAKACGFPSKIGDSSKFHELWAKNKPGAITMCKNHVEIEILIAAMCGYK